MAKGIRDPGNAELARVHREDQQSAYPVVADPVRAPNKPDMLAGSQPDSYFKPPKPSSGSGGGPRRRLR